MNMFPIIVGVLFLRELFADDFYVGGLRRVGKQVAWI